MIYSHDQYFSEMAQASPTKHFLSRCYYDLYDEKVTTSCGQIFQLHNYFNYFTQPETHSSCGRHFNLNKDQWIWELG